MCIRDSCKRVQLLVGGFQIPNLDYAGSMTQYTVTDWASGMTGAYQGLSLIHI